MIYLRKVNKYLDYWSYWCYRSYRCGWRDTESAIYIGEMETF